MIADPKLLILDEPANGPDPLIQKRLFEMLTVIFAISFIGCMLVDPKDYEFAMPLALLIKLEFIIQAVYFLIGFMISTVLPSSRQVTPAVLEIFSQVVDKLKNLKYISPYNYALPANIVKKDYIMDTAYIVLII